MPITKPTDGEMQTLNVVVGRRVVFKSRTSAWANNKGVSILWLSSGAFPLQALEQVLDPNSTSQELRSFTFHQGEGALANPVDSRHAPEIDNELAFRPCVAGLFPVGTKLRCPGFSKPPFENEPLFRRSIDSRDL